MSKDVTHSARRCTVCTQDVRIYTHIRKLLLLYYELHKTDYVHRSHAVSFKLMT